MAKLFLQAKKMHKIRYGACPEALLKPHYLFEYHIERRKQKHGSEESLRQWDVVEYEDDAGVADITDVSEEYIEKVGATTRKRAPALLRHWRASFRFRLL